MSIRVLVFDDHPVIHHGLNKLLGERGIQVVGHAYDGIRPVEKIRQVQPDVVLMDVRMPRLDGIKALDDIQQAELDVPVIMFSEHENPTYIARAISLGAFDYVLKSTPQDQLVTAIRDAAQGKSPADHSLFQSMKRKMRLRKVHINGMHSLTNRELQVLKHLALGLSNREIGDSLGISVETVKEHVQNILRKQNSSDRTEAAVWAVKQGIA